ncbi:ATP-binding protein [Aestuariibacter sp. AA17]|uniref:histidine kinase n=1 Tax=Fluctibacter corallii TaxID=2984329 RepID=A0ABT3AAT1_9ALTE|nr:ATP-binding protein [Aestuariibacter sp. AA17]MCV2885677.1 ATP-binding protein [Aestuariibacter sp. AA17]
MSSTHSVNVHKASVFRLTVLWSLLLTVVIAALLFVIETIWISHAESAYRERIEEEWHWVEEVFEHDGIDELLSHFDEDGVIWSSDYLEDVAGGEGLVFQLRDDEDTVVAGFPNFTTENEWARTTLSSEHHRYDMFVLTAPLDEDYRMSVGKIVSSPFLHLEKVFSYGYLIVLIGALPFSLLCGWLVSRSVNRRLSALVSAASQIQTGNIDTRCIVSPRYDEFDQVAIQFNRMMDSIASLHRQIEDTAVGVAHDLRTPLTHVDQHLQRISRHIHQPEVVASHAEMARDSVSQLMQTFNALVRLGELASGKYKSQFTEIDIGALSQDLFESYQVVFEEAGKSLTLNANATSPILGDAGLLSQLLVNLLENALQYSQPNAQVWISLFETANSVTMVVGDNGPGISPQERERIFERFYRGDKSRSTSGNGLGLSLVASICQLHQATITVKDGTPGAEFVINFPTP